MELRRGERGVLRIGHRGAAALARENSLAAIEAAAAHDAHAVELDVLRGADGSLVLAHGHDRVRAGVQPGVPLLIPRVDAGQVEVDAARLDVESRDGLSRHASPTPP